jgi:hypothetical protein
MGYCNTVWVSDYNYKKALTNRQSGSIPIIVPTLVGDSAAMRSLLLWGRISDDIPVLEPVFQMAVDALPPQPGDQVLEGFDPKGERLFSVSFSLTKVGCLPQGTSGHFSFSIPISAADAAQLAELRWTKAGVLMARKAGASSVSAKAVAPTDEPLTQAMFDGRTRLLWDAAADPMVLVRDKATGLVLGIGEGGDFRFSADAEDLELHFSDGVRSHSVLVKRPKAWD